MARYSFKNISGQTIPPFAVMQLSAVLVVDQLPLYQMIQPNADFQRVYYVNGPVEVPNNATGQCSDAAPNDPVYALYQADSEEDYDQPAMFQGWGTRASSWYLQRGGYGFTVIGPANDEGASKIRTLAVDSTPTATFTTTFTQEPAKDADEDDEDNDDEAGVEDDDDDEQGGDEYQEIDTEDHTCDHVLVKQEPVLQVWGILQSALASFPDSQGGSGSGDYAWDTSRADVLITLPKPDYSTSPAHLQDQATSSQYLRNVIPSCIASGKQYNASDQVVCLFMAGFWIAMQSAICPSAAGTS